jgi:hypothetical protein
MLSSCGFWASPPLTFKTIADFRKDNLEAIKGVCRQFTLLCKKLELFSSELVAIDGSKFKAVNNRKRNFNQKRLDAALKGMDEKIDRYLRDLDEEDAQEADSRFFSKVELDEKIKQLQERKQKYQSLSQKLKASGEKQVSLTDPDSRLMPVGQTTDVCIEIKAQ